MDLAQLMDKARVGGISHVDIIHNWYICITRLRYVIFYFILFFAPLAGG